MYQCPVEKKPCESFGAHNFCECEPTKDTTPTSKYATETPQGWMETRLARQAGLWYNAGSDQVGYPQK